MNDELIEELVKRAMEDFKIPKKTAIAGLLLYMCGHGSIEDFKEVVNYTIKNQERERKLMRKK